MQRQYSYGYIYHMLRFDDWIANYHISSNRTSNTNQFGNIRPWIVYVLRKHGDREASNLRKPGKEDDEPFANLEIDKEASSLQ